MKSILIYVQHAKDFNYFISVGKANDSGRYNVRSHMIGSWVYPDGGWLFNNARLEFFS